MRRAERANSNQRALQRGLDREGRAPSIRWPRFFSCFVMSGMGFVMSGCTNAQTPETATVRTPATTGETNSPVTATASSPPSTPTSTAVAANPRASTRAPGESGAPTSTTALGPLGAEADLVPLAVAGFRDAVIAVPNGATSARPVVLALHGNFDRPEWQCDVWRGITRGRAFVLCPRGIPRPDAPKSLDRWTYGKGTAVRAEIDAALAALRARFPGYIAEGPLLYTGFSLGAIHGVGIIASDASRYPRAVLVEGGHDGFTAERAKAFAAGGGKRVLFACGQRACKAEAAAARKNLERAGVETDLVFGGEVGHTYDGPVAAEVARVWTWLVAGDPRFAEAGQRGENPGGT